MLPQQIKLRLSDEARIAEERQTAEALVAEMEEEVGVDGILWVGAGNGSRSSGSVHTNSGSNNSGGGGGANNGGANNGNGNGGANNSVTDALIARHNMVRMLTEMDAGTAITQMTKMLQRAATSHKAAATNTDGGSSKSADKFNNSKSVTPKKAEAGGNSSGSNSANSSATKLKGAEKTADKTSPCQTSSKSEHEASPSASGSSSDSTETKVQRLQEQIQKLMAEFERKRKEIYQKRVRFAHAVLAHSEPWAQNQNVIRPGTNTALVNPAQNLKGGGKGKTGPGPGGKGIGVPAGITTTNCSTSTATSTNKGGGKGVIGVKGDAASAQAAAGRKAAAEHEASLQAQIARATSPLKNIGLSSAKKTAQGEDNVDKHNDNIVESLASRNAKIGSHSGIKSGGESPIRALQSLSTSKSTSTRKSPRRGDLQSPLVSPTNAGSISVQKTFKDGEHASSSPSKKVGSADTGKGKGKSSSGKGSGAKGGNVGTSGASKKRRDSDEDDDSEDEDKSNKEDSDDSNDSETSPENMDEALCCYVSDNDMTFSDGKSEGKSDECKSDDEIGKSLSEDGAEDGTVADGDADTHPDPNTDSNGAKSPKPKDLETASAAKVETEATVVGSPIRSPPATLTTPNITPQRGSHNNLSNNLSDQQNMQSPSHMIPFVPTFTVRKWANAKTIFEKSSLCEHWEKVGRRILFIRIVSVIIRFWKKIRHIMISQQVCAQHDFVKIEINAQFFQHFPRVSQKSK
jgi:hypothetical protein